MEIKNRKPTKFLNEAVNRTALIDKALMYFEIFMHNKQDEQIYKRDFVAMDALNTLNSLLSEGMLKTSYSKSAVQDNQILQKIVMSDDIVDGIHEDEVEEGVPFEQI